MCNFFSFVTEPEKHGGKRFYFDWNYRSSHLEDKNHDSHSSICEHFGLDEDVCNKYEYNPLTKKFKIDQINSDIDDRLQAEDWVNNVNFKRIVKPLIIKPIVNPFDLPKVEHVTDEHIELLKQWTSQELIKFIDNPIVEDAEVCEWVGKVDEFISGCDKGLYWISEGEFEYCPNCGKRIKYVEREERRNDNDE